MKTRYLNMRFGTEMIAVFGLNAFFIIIFLTTIYTQGLNFIQKSAPGYITLLIIYNIVPAIIMYPKISEQNRLRRWRGFYPKNGWKVALPEERACKNGIG